MTGENNIQIWTSEENLGEKNQISNNWPLARNSKQQAEQTEQRLRRATMVAHLISPLVATTFAVVYWVIGMYNVMFPGREGEM